MTLRILGIRRWLPCSHKEMGMLSKNTLIGCGIALQVPKVYWENIPHTIILPGADWKLILGRMDLFVHVHTKFWPCHPNIATEIENFILANFGRTLWTPILRLCFIGQDWNLVSISNLLANQLIMVQHAHLEKVISTPCWSPTRHFCPCNRHFFQIPPLQTPKDGCSWKSQQISSFLTWLSGTNDNTMVVFTWTFSLVHSDALLELLQVVFPTSTCLDAFSCCRVIGWVGN